MNDQRTLLRARCTTFLLMLAYRAIYRQPDRRWTFGEGRIHERYFNA